MRTIKKEFKEVVQAHVLAALSTDETEVVSEQLQNVVDGFKNWYGAYEQKRIPNYHEAFKDWLMGLPSSFNTEYEHYRISEVLKEWFDACGELYKEHDGDKEAALYYHLVTREFQTLCKKNKVGGIV